MAKKIDVGGELNSTALDKKLVDAVQVKDGSRGDKTLVKTNEEIEYLLAQEGERQKQFEANEAARQAEADKTEQDRADEAARTEAERQATFDANEAERQVLYEKVAKNTEGVELLNANTGVSEYSEFSEATAYSVGEVVLYEGLLKRFTSTHEPGAWDASQVEDWSERKEVNSNINNTNLLIGETIVLNPNSELVYNGISAIMSNSPYKGFVFKLIKNVKYDFSANNLVTFAQIPRAGDIPNNVFNSGVALIGEDFSDNYGLFTLDTRETSTANINVKILKKEEYEQIIIDSKAIDERLQRTEGSVKDNLEVVIPINILSDDNSGRFTYILSDLPSSILKVHKEIGACDVFDIYKSSTVQLKDLELIESRKAFDTEIHIEIDPKKPVIYLYNSTNNPDGFKGTVKYSAINGLTGKIMSLDTITGSSKYPEFNKDKHYGVGEIVRYNGCMYRFTNVYTPSDTSQWDENIVEEWNQGKEIYRNSVEGFSPFLDECLIKPNTNLVLDNTTNIIAESASKFKGHIFKLIKGCSYVAKGSLSISTFRNFPSVGDTPIDVVTKSEIVIPEDTDATYGLITLPPDGIYIKTNLKKLTTEDYDETITTLQADINLLKNNTQGSPSSGDILIAGTEENPARFTKILTGFPAKFILKVTKDKGVTETFDIYKASSTSLTDLEIVNSQTQFGAEIILETDEHKPVIYLYSSTENPEGFTGSYSIWDYHGVMISLKRLERDIYPDIYPDSHLNIVCFGDSITEFKDSNNKSYTDYLASLFHCNVYNCGIGGSRLSQRTDVDDISTINKAYAALDICNMVDWWVTDSWDIADAAVQYLIDNTSDDNTAQIATLKNIKLQETDIVIVFGGTNDFTGDSTLGTEDNEDKNTILGGLTHIIKTIQKANPAIKLYILTPIVRWFGDERVEAQWSDNYIASSGGLNGKKLPELCEEIKKISKKHHTPCKDLYWELGWNEFNFSNYFNDNDGTHPYKGFADLASAVHKFIKSY